jgi:hypothetical protein
LQHCRSGFALPSGKGSDPLSEKADQKCRGGFGSEAASAAGSGGIAVGKWREPPESTHGTKRVQRLSQDEWKLRKTQATYGAMVL